MWNNKYKKTKIKLTTNNIKANQIIQQTYMQTTNQSIYSQGFGLTEHGTRGKLTEGQTTFIDNDDCVEEIIQYFTTQVALFKCQRIIQLTFKKS